MKRHFLSVIVISIVFYSFPSIGQTTFYSRSYPDGLVAKSFEKKRRKYLIKPIENLGLEIIIRFTSEPLIKDSGQIIQLEEDIKDKAVVLSMNSRTGELDYSEEVKFPGMSKLSLFKAYKQFGQGRTQYRIGSLDEEDHTFIKYQGYFQASFSGDQHYIGFNLTVWFKDDKIKYEFTDFTVGFSYTRHTSYWGFAGNSRNINLHKTMGEFYGRNFRYSDFDEFWIPVKQDIEAAIKLVHVHGLKVQEYDGW
jgi:hypothetical protein